MWGALSDERTGRSFTIGAGPRQRSYSRVRDSRPYFTVSDSKLSFSSPPTTRRATVEVFDPALTQARTPRKTPPAVIKNTCLLVRYLAMDVLLLAMTICVTITYRLS
jgi:hypothetical protein